MAESKSNQFQCDEWRRGVKTRATWVASRPEVISVLQNVTVCGWGAIAEFHGSEAELIAAGIATPDMFEDMGKSGQRTRHFSFGDRYTIKRRRGKWDLGIWTNKDVRDGLPTDECPEQCAWWKKNRAATEAVTAEILSRFARR